MRPPLVALAAVGAVHLGAQLVDPGGLAVAVTQALLMPSLAWVLVSGAPSLRPRLVRLTRVALAFSWLGDTLPRFAGEDVRFLVMIGCFLLAQVTYTIAFFPHWRASIVRRRPILLLPYAAGLARVVSASHARAGSLLVPLIFYGLALGTMAVLATGLGWVAGIGGALFVLSDSLIALRTFADVGLPAHDFWVMLSYVAGQTLLVLAVIRVQGGDLLRRAR
ncbi:lysoplasmalogenase [Intrasporangium sp. DVR]|uniref:lysoplasmalogenase n=1 Tax=Intrasporangium sp. DVR TaxID=3127867 RepID=UPI00313A5A38